MNINENYRPEDFITTIIEERDLKLKFAIWDQIEFLSEDMGIDNPEKIINTIRNNIESYFLEYFPMNESFEEGIED